MDFKATEISDSLSDEDDNYEKVGVILQCLIGKVIKLRLYNIHPYAFKEVSEQEVIESIVVSKEERFIRNALYLVIGGDYRYLGIKSLKEVLNFKMNNFKIMLMLRGDNTRSEYTIMRSYINQKDESIWSINYRASDYESVRRLYEKFGISPGPKSEAELDCVYSMIEEEEERLTHLLDGMGTTENITEETRAHETKTVVLEMLEEIRALRLEIDESREASAQRMSRKRRLDSG